MLSVTEAQKRVLSSSAPLPVERVRVAEAMGRVLAEDVVAVRTLPPWKNSAMDGYAVRSADGVRRLQVVETIHAGATPSRVIGPGECARIMTGAPMPSGADAVVMQERTRREGETVELFEAATPGQNVRQEGEDALRGEVLLSQRTPIGIPEAGLLWGQGFADVGVHRRPKVAIASTGDELCPVESPKEGRIADTNSPMLAAATRRAGALPTLLGIARDELDEVERVFSGGLTHDVLLTCAGVSVGEKDFARDALSRLGVELSFWKVAMRPGKPLLVGLKGRTLVFGLPGNPTSALVTFELFVRPCLRRLLGFADAGPPRVRGRTEVAFQKPAGVTHFIRVIARWHEGETWVRPLPSQTSGALRSAAAATHLLELGPDTTELLAGEPATLLPLSWTP
ncbi:MAG: gephyrin-like molybdotransferase Glp [Myxococcota bacterium]